MNTRRAIHQFVSTLGYGDAISNHTIEMMKTLRAWGHASEIFVEMCDPRVAKCCRPYTTYEDDPDDILVYQYGVGSQLTDFLRSRMNRTVLYYHNVTPPHFYENIDPELAGRLKRGRDDLRRRCGEFKGALTVSEHNRQELLAIGFDDVEVIPILLNLPALTRSAACLAGRRIEKQFDDGYVNILFVGRLSPNKKQEDLLQALAYYRHLVDSRARLLLVGSWGNFRYKARVEMLAEHLGISECTHFSGHLELGDGFGGYYRAATVFLSLSEHEGFGVPLIESMYFGVPIIAYESSAVPETLGGCGFLLTEKRYDVIGELIYNLVTDQALTQQVVRKQRERLAAFDRATVQSQIKSWVESLAHDV